MLGFADKAKLAEEQEVEGNGCIYAIPCADCRYNGEVKGGTEGSLLKVSPKYHSLTFLRYCRPT